MMQKSEATAKPAEKQCEQCFVLSRSLLSRLVWDTCRETSSYSSHEGNKETANSREVSSGFAGMKGRLAQSDNVSTTNRSVRHKQRNFQFWRRRVSAGRSKW